MGRPYIISLFLICVTIFGCGLDCVEKKTGMHKSSRSIEESRQHGVFKFEMFTNKKYFNLANKKSFKITTAWVENGWWYDCINNDAVLKKDNFYQFVIDGKYTYVTDSLHYVLMESDNRRGNFLGGQLSFNYLGQDTLLLTLSENNTKAIIDTLKFVKQPNRPTN